MIIKPGMYKDSNCAKCMHQEVCSIRDEYISYLVELRKIVDPKLDKFAIEIKCIFHSENVMMRLTPQSSGFQNLPFQM